MKVRVSHVQKKGALVIRHVDKFPEREFARLQRTVFADVQQASNELAATLTVEALPNTASNIAHTPMYRMGAYFEAELVGWSCGWMERSRF